jgi:hypothetical protein
VLIFCFPRRVSEETLDLLEAFTRRIGQIPIRLAKVTNGYV